MEYVNYNIFYVYNKLFNLIHENIKVYDKMDIYYYFYI